MRYLAVALLAAPLALAACGSEDTDTDGTTDTSDTNDTLSSADRLGVPEKYKFLWNTVEGCETADGGVGTQVYWHTSDAESIPANDGNFNLRATETWYWFHGDNSAQDCKDVWLIEGGFQRTDYQLLGCSECEEAYYFRRTLIEQGCQYGYSGLFGFAAEDPVPDPQAYEGYILFDTHTTFNGSPNEDNKMLVVARYRAPSGFTLNNSYAQPGMSKRIVDDPARQGPPGKYEWAGTSCVGSSDGGGGGA